MIENGRKIFLGDLLSDPVVVFQKENYYKLVFLIWFLLPIILPCLIWNESLENSFFICVTLRYVLSLHSTWTINSLAHRFGTRIYDENILPRDNLIVTLLTLGDGYHNYHHTYARDYAGSEYGRKFNIITAFIDICSAMGLAYDLKTVSKNYVLNTKLE